MRVGLVIAVIAAAGLLAGASAPINIQAFARIQPGGWQLRPLDGSPPRRICVADGFELIQLRHPGAACSRFVLVNDPQTATVHYTCTGAGYGRTTINVETGQLIRLESQGLVGQAPFQTAYEGRRVGLCVPETSRR